jgi:predicted permease
MLRLFADHLLPVLLVAAAGWALAARTKLDARSVSSVAFSVLAPCFVFDVIMKSGAHPAALFRMMGFAFATLLVLAAVMALIAKLLGWSRGTIAAAALVVMLPNAGNYGLSANLFAFGEAGLEQAGLFFVASTLLTFTLGVLLVSMGRRPPREALAGLARVPAVWAMLLAAALLTTGRTLPFPVQRAVDLLASACVPTFIVVLGVQLHGRGVRAPWGPVLAASALRLLGGPALAWVMARAFGLEAAARQSGVLQSAMPSAVICTILAAEYDAEPDFVTAVVVVTTLASPLTLTPLLALLGA